VGNSPREGVHGYVPVSRMGVSTSHRTRPMHPMRLWWNRNHRRSTTVARAGVSSRPPRRFHRAVVRNVRAQIYDQLERFSYGSNDKKNDKLRKAVMVYRPRAELSFRSNAQIAFVSYIAYDKQAMVSLPRSRHRSLCFKATLHLQVLVPAWSIADAVGIFNIDKLCKYGPTSGLKGFQILHSCHFFEGFPSRFV